ncbi:hypothetical protein SEA_YOSIF_33 [Streptomyces phage Yosif]|uniref:Uncharacterized protein n=1 Tax=Streptomyces phage Yosif TaxID=2201421 RepID=A0A2Z4QBW3_9CAUD|nr:hypothetical protein KGG71_gp33 [Streptomyces phage Yosif]AWY07597.1 hypothetical protein SEA_YOSIF_33 [Streptomyces phage Yosif]
MVPLRHIERALPAWDKTQGVPRSFVTTDGAISFHFDQEAYDFHIDASPGYKAATMATVLQQIRWWGLEVMDDDECPPELLDGGITRIYLTPTVPVEVAEAEAMAELLAEVDLLALAQEPELFKRPEHKPAPTRRDWVVNVLIPWLIFQPHIPQATLRTGLMTIGVV